VLRGGKIFNYAKATPHNLTLYLSFLKLRNENPTYLLETHGEMEGGWHKLVVMANQAIIIPGNTIHSVLSIADSIVIAFNFIHKRGIFTACQSYCNERIINEDYDNCYANFVELTAVVLTRAMTS
jgi:hypothetical protein